MAFSTYILTDADFDKYEQWHKEKYPVPSEPVPSYLVPAQPLDASFRKLRKQWKGRDLVEWSTHLPSETGETLDDWIIQQLMMKMEWIMFPVH